MKINSITVALVAFASASSATAKWARLRSGKSSMIPPTTLLVREARWLTRHVEGDCLGDNLGQVSINNQGCVFEPNATSVKIDRATNFTKKRCLVMSKGDNCECQSGSIPFTATGGGESPSMQSSSFIRLSC